MVGPHYQRPPVAVPAQWKEGPVQEGVSPGQWWEAFGDPVLNRLQEQAVAANQQLQQAVARVTEARALARVSAADLYPTVTLDPSAIRSRLSANRPNPTQSSSRSFTSTAFLAPLDMSYEVDLWGRVRHSLEAAHAEAAARVADLQVVLLTLTADVAQTYFALRTVESQRALLDRTVNLLRESSQLVQIRFAGGIASELEVAQAETLLATTEATALSLAQQRATLEHALAVLVGVPAEDFGVPENRLDLSPPVIPAGLPSALLERRPDVVEAEQLMVAANACIGVA